MTRIAEIPRCLLRLRGDPSTASSTRFARSESAQDACLPKFYIKVGRAEISRWLCSLEMTVGIIEMISSQTSDVGHRMKMEIGGD